jgi:hypothetical protein
MKKLLFPITALIVFTFSLIYLFHYSDLAKKVAQRMTKNDYHEAFVIDGYYDNSGNLCRSGGVKPEWIIKGSVVKYLKGEAYLFYVIPEKEHPRNYTYNLDTKKIEICKDALFSETGYVKFSDVFNIQCENPASRVSGPKLFLRYL